MITRMKTRTLAVGTVIAVLTAFGLFMSASAMAVSYRYWTYWQAPIGNWDFATAGPATTVPPDASVEGWRFALTTTAGGTRDQPRITPTFTELCKDTPAVAGTKRVGLVIDFGDASASPAGQAPLANIATCVAAEPTATGYQILRSMTQVRTDEVGLICGLGGYPSTGCAELVDDASASNSAGSLGTQASDPTPDVLAVSPTSGESSAAPESSLSPATVLIAILITGFGIAAVVIARGRRL